VHTVLQTGDEFMKPFWWDVLGPYGVKVVREYWMPREWRADKPVLSVPLGPFLDLEMMGVAPVAMRERARSYGWFFAGDLNKPENDEATLISRPYMLNLFLQTVPDGLYYTHFHGFGNALLSPRTYLTYLCDTYFAPVPHGYAALECFRLYEALECGAIPVALAMDLPFYLDHSDGLWGSYEGRLGGVLWVESWHQAAELINHYMSQERAARARGLPSVLAPWADAARSLWHQWRDAVGERVRAFVWGVPGLEEVGGDWPRTPHAWDDKDAVHISGKDYFDPNRTTKAWGQWISIGSKPSTIASF
jgi:hypothetical protein